MPLVRVQATPSGTIFGESRDPLPALRRHECGDRVGPVCRGQYDQEEEAEREQEAARAGSPACAYGRALVTGRWAMNHPLSWRRSVTYAGPGVERQAPGSVNHRAAHGAREVDATARE